MTLPEYKINLIPSVDIELDQLLSNDSTDIKVPITASATPSVFQGFRSYDRELFGTGGVRERVGQTFKPLIFETIARVQVAVTVNGSPTDELECRITNADFSVVYEISPLKASASDVGSGFFIFTFTTPVVGGVTYGIECRRTGLRDTSNYWKIGYESVVSPDPYTNGALYNQYSGVWVIVTSPYVYSDMQFIVWFGPKFIDFEQKIVMPKNGILSSISIWTNKIGSPTDSLEMKLYDSIFTLLQTSNNTQSGTGKLTFNFDEEYMNEDAIFYYRIYRKTQTSQIAYWELLLQNTNPYADGFMREYDVNTSMWINRATWDMKFEIEYFGDGDLIDISDDMYNININTGKNNVDSTIIQGVTQLTVINKTGKYSPENSASSLYPNFRLFNKIQISVIYDSTEYFLFTGFINNITPAMAISEGYITITIGDRFYPLSGDEVTLGLLTTKTASQLVAEIVENLNLFSNEYDIQADGQALATVTWDNVNALSKLNTVVEVGQHHHFITPEGVYTFRNNQWLIGATPDYIINVEDPDKATIEYIHSSIYNVIRVHYDATYIEVDDDNSKDTYGFKLFEMDNELMIGPTYATTIANILLVFYKQPGRNLKITISDDFPMILQAAFGEMIEYTDTAHGIDGDYIIFGLTHDISKEGIHKLELNCRRET